MNHGHHENGSIEAAAAAVMDLEDGLGSTHGLMVVRNGTVLVERYDDAHGPNDLLLSWSVAKSVTHALVGIAAADGLIDVTAPAAVAEWRGDERRHITVAHLLAMSSGLFFREDYVDGEQSDVIEMLFGAGKADMGAFAASMPLVREPGSTCSYASGSTNIITRLLADATGHRGDAFEAWMRSRLFDPIGIGEARLGFDESGVWVGSSFLSLSLRDWTRFGELYLAGGEGVLPPGWVEDARRATPTPPSEAHPYGSHWWRWPRYPSAFAAHGYEGQHVIVLPAANAVICRFGSTPDARKLEIRARLVALTDAVVAAFA
jgi:CubicO group peptidase (beta-lactamase class C family)